MQVYVPPLQLNTPILLVLWKFVSTPFEQPTSWLMEKLLTSMNRMHTNFQVILCILDLGNFVTF